MQRRRADAKAHLAAGDDRGDEIAAAAACGLGHRESGERDGRAGMRAGAGLAQAVELEGMGEGAERQRRLARIEPVVEPRHRAGARAPEAAIMPAIARDHGRSAPKIAQAAASIRQVLAVAMIGAGRSA